jgi:tetraacyldisaccharide 4'-kinase
VNVLRKVRKGFNFAYLAGVVNPRFTTPLLIMSSRWMKRMAVRARQFEEFAVDVVYDRREANAGVKLLGGFMLGLSCVFDGIVRLRCWLYHQRIFRDQRLGVPVVVVGNLTVGGTGKTPIVEKFARSLAQRGRHVAILSRGYKSRAEPAHRRLWRWISHGEDPPPKIVSDGQNVLLDSAEAGDEPFMLARNLPGVVVLVGKNRVKAGQYAIRKFGSDILLLDDGFQYLSLRGQHNVLLVDKTNPFGNRHLLPRGILREPVRHLRRASYVFITKSDGRADGELRETIRQFHPEVEVIECTHRPTYLQSINNGGQRRPLEDLRGRRVAAFCGIAMPESFEKILRELGAEIVCKKRFLDHHRFTPEDLERFFSRAVEAQADFIVTTEKDAVRLSADLVSTIPLYYLRLEIEILSGDHDFDAAVSRICFPRGHLNQSRAPFPAEVEEYADE